MQFQSQKLSTLKLRFYLPHKLWNQCDKNLLNREYYTVARRCEFYVWVAGTISHEWAQRMSEILLLPQEHKIHIFELTCNILFII